MILRGDEDKKQETTLAFGEDKTLIFLITTLLIHIIIFIKRSSQFLIANAYLINAKG